MLPLCSAEHESEADEVGDRYCCCSLTLQVCGQRPVVTLGGAKDAQLQQACVYFQVSSVQGLSLKLEAFCFSSTAVER